MILSSRFLNLHFFPNQLWNFSTYIFQPFIIFLTFLPFFKWLSFPASFGLILPQSKRTIVLGGLESTNDNFMIFEWSLWSVVALIGWWWLIEEYWPLCKVRWWWWVHWQCAYAALVCVAYSVFECLTIKINNFKI